MGIRQRAEIGRPLRSLVYLSWRDDDGMDKSDNGENGKNTWNMDRNLRGNTV